MLQISPGLDVMGGLSWHLSLSLLGAWVIVFFCIMKGVRSIGKVCCCINFIPVVLRVAVVINSSC